MSLDILDLKDYGPRNERGSRYILVAIENFNQFGWTVPLKHKKGQTIKDAFENILKSSKRSPNLIETDRGKEILSKILTDSVKTILKKF